MQKPAPWLKPLSDSLTAAFHVPGNEVLSRILFVLALLVTALQCTGIFIRIYIKKLQGSSTFEKTGATDGGYLIGVLERLLVITAIATGKSEWISIVLGVKSIARFRRFKEDAFVEYFLIGSFLSFFVAIVAGFLIRRLFNNRTYG